MAVRTPTAIHLCDGYGGFELAFRHAFTHDDRPRTVARVERDSYAAAVLVARMAEKALDQAPVWDDLCTFDGSAWRGRVDWITAGFSCQPFSSAGKRLGVDDERWIWPDIARIIADVGPRFVLLENVPGLIRLGLPHVLADLAALGLDAEWGCLAASAVGAPHRRERIWILAYADGAGVEGLGQNRRPGPTQREVTRLDREHVADANDNGSASGGTVGLDIAGELDICPVARRCETVGDASGTGGSAVTRGAYGDEGGVRSIDGDEPDGPVEDVADAAGIDEREPHNETRTEPRQDTRPHAGRVSFPPRPDDLDGWAEWTAAGGPEPQLRRRADGPPLGLADALHLGGNGLVPQAAAEALRQLAARMIAT